MAIVGIFSMNPTTVIAMIDQSVWEVVLFSGSPKTTADYNAFVEKRKSLPKKELEKHKSAVQAVIGVDNLKKCSTEGVFWSTVIFDSAPNLMRLKEQVEDVEILDITTAIPGKYAPKPVSPKTLNKFLDKEGEIGELPKFAMDPSYASAIVIEETTSRFEEEQIDEHGVAYPDTPNGFRTMMKELLEECGDQWVDAADSFFVQYLFHCCTRSFITSKVTRKLPTPKAKTIWKRMLEFADSDVGYVMYSAFYMLCQEDDPEYTPQTAVLDFSLTPYAKDFMYAISIMPVSQAYDFLVELGDESRERKELPSLKVKKVKKAPSKGKKKGKGKGKKGS